MLYKVYEKGNFVISHDLNDKGAKCFAQSPTNLAVQTVVMSCAEKERCFL